MKYHDINYHVHKQYSAEKVATLLEEFKELKKEVAYLRRINRFTVWYLNRYHPYFKNDINEKIKKEIFNDS